MLPSESGRGPWAGPVGGAEPAGAAAASLLPLEPVVPTRLLHFPLALYRMATVSGQGSEVRV